MPPPSWQRALDDFDTHLRRQRAAFEAGRPEAIVAFVPPPGLGALPEALAERAGSLLVAAEALEADLAEATEAAARRLGSLRATPPPRTPSFFDARA